MHSTLRLHNRLVIWLWMLCAAGWGVAHANEPVGELELKAAYIFNFIQFIEWPDSDAATASDMTLCVSPFSPLKRPLAALEGKQAAKGRAVRVKLLEPASLRHCRVLILHNADVEPALRALRALPAAHGILTISDELTFTNPEIVIALTEQQGRVVFGINAEAAAKAGLTISSRLLRLAKAGR
ncbi:MAG: YfiR family protein [Acidovorax sp.]|nr:YfiR family protein [Acidovorax sp.]